MSRHNYKWTINELLALQREYELLALPIPVIAAKHKRTTQAIIHKLIAEEIFYMNGDDDYSSSSDSSSVNDDLYEDDDIQTTVWVTEEDVFVTEEEEKETVTEKKELPEDDTNVEYVYIHQYVWNVFYNYFFPDKISYRYKLL